MSERNMSMREHLSELFKDDPLYMALERENEIERVMHDPVIENLYFGMNYSTGQVAELLGVKDWQIRNYLKSYNLNEYYLKVGKAGNQHRFDYKSIFRFKMMFHLAEKTGKTAQDMAILVGSEAEIRPYTPPLSRTPANQSQSDIQVEIKHMREIMQWMRNEQEQYRLEFLLTTLKQERQTWENEFKNIVEQIEIIEWSKHQQKTNAAFLDTLKQQQQRKGFFSGLFSKKEDPEIDQLESQIEKEKEHVNDMDQRYQSLVEQRKKMEEEKKEKYTEWDDQQKQLEEQLQQINQYLEEIKGNKNLHTSERGDQPKYLDMEPNDHS